MTVTHTSSETGITCPSCDHVNTPWRNLCEICRAPLNETTIDMRHSIPDRPGCLTAYAILLFILGIGAGVFGLWAMTISMPEFLIFGLAIALLAIPISIGLWYQRNWARITVIVLQIINISYYLFGIFSGNSLESIIGLPISGIILYWFLNNRDIFR